jgi:superfamily II DNA or RNA helicase
MLLRPRQSEFVARSVAALSAHGNTLAVAPTGFGKTVAMAAIVRHLLARSGRAEGGWKTKER